MTPGSLAPVSVVVINYNGRRYLRDCLDSTLAQTTPPRELLVVDNRSSDDSVSILRELFPDVALTQLSRNGGYAAAANVGIGQTRAPYVLLLNPDVILMPGFLAAILADAEVHPDAGSFTGKLLSFRPATGVPIIDSTGHILFRNRCAENRGAGEPDVGQYERGEEVFGVSGAAPLYRRAMLEDVGLGTQYFAERFFLDLEDVDLDFRARLRGWGARYVPGAVAYHDRAARHGVFGRDARVLRHCVRNRYLTMVRNESVRDLVCDAHALLPWELLRSLDLLVTAPRALPAYWDAVRALPATLAERRAIRGRVRAPREEIRRWLRPYPYWRRLVRRFQRARVRSSPKPAGRDGAPGSEPGDPGAPATPAAPTGRPG